MEVKRRKYLKKQRVEVLNEVYKVTMDFSLKRYDLNPGRLGGIIVKEGYAEWVKERIVN